MASCMAMWTSDTSSMPCGPGRMTVTASIVMAFQSLTASACASAEKPSAPHMTMPDSATPASLDLNIVVLLLQCWRDLAGVRDDDRAGIDVRNSAGSRLLGAAVQVGTELDRDQACLGDAADAAGGKLDPAKQRLGARLGLEVEVGKAHNLLPHFFSLGRGRGLCSGRQAADQQCGHKGRGLHLVSPVNGLNEQRKSRSGGGNGGSTEKPPGLGGSSPKGHERV